MKATQILIHEHGVIAQGLAVLDAMAARLAGGESVPARDPEQVLEFFTAFAYGCHHAKEEVILFPTLEVAGAPRDGPTALLPAEHADGRRLVGRLQREVNDGQADEEARRRFVDAAREYAALLEQHISMENEVFFPDAETILAEETDREIAAAFERHEALEMGSGVHERFHRLLDDLAAR